MIEVRRVSESKDFFALREVWDGLLVTSSISDAFLTWEWLSTWWKHFGNSYALRLYVAQEHERVVGIAPLMLEARKVAGRTQRVLRNIGVPPPDVGGFLVDHGRPDVLAALIRAIAEDRREWDFLQIREIPPGGLDLSLLSNSFPPRQVVVEVTHSRHYSARISGDWETYFKGLSRNLRRDLSKKQRHLEMEGAMAFRRLLGSEAGPEDMRKVFDISKNARHSYLYERAIDRDFHIELAEKMALRGWLDLSFLDVDGRPVAFRYGFRYEDRYEDWRTGFDDRYFAQSVGKILLMLLLKDCFARKMREFHFLRGDEDYKARWQVEELEYAHVFVVQRKLWPLLFQLCIPRAKRRIKSTLKRRQHLSSLVRWYDRWRGNR